MANGIGIRDRVLKTQNPDLWAAEQEVAAQPAPTGYSPQQQQDAMAWLGQIDPQKMFSAENITGAAKTAEDTAARERQVNATNDRYGTDLSWLDPSFQYDATTIGASAGASAGADPNAIAAQSAAMQQAQSMANTSLQFQSPAQQQAMAAQWAQIQGGQGAPQFMGNAQQQALMQQALGTTLNSGPGALSFDNGARQGEQYGNLRDIIAGGGATAIEMADRQRGRADSESWLRGQREADMANYAERGLTGSGMELLALSGDRQAAAGRNSLADLETSKALEERRLGAIKSAADLGTSMRSNTIDEQSLLNNRSLTGLNSATSLMNNMRSQDYNERTYLADRQTDALKQGTDLQSKMRDQQYNEQIGNRNALQSSLDTFARTSTQARDSSAQESQYRGTAEDKRLELNQEAINRAKQDNQQALTGGYEQMMDNRVRISEGQQDRNTRIALGLNDSDVTENMAGYRQGDAVGGKVSDQFNDGQTNYNDTVTGVTTGANANTRGAQQQANTIYPKLGAVGAEYVNTVVGGAVNAGSGASGGSLSNPGTTWAQSAGSAAPGNTGVAGNFDWDAIRKKIESGA